MPITFAPPQPLAPGVSADYGATQAFEKFLPSLQEQQRLRSQTIQQGLGRDQQAFEAQQGRIAQQQQQNQRFQQQMQLQQLDLSQAEQLRLQRLHQGMSYVDDQVSNGSLGEDEGNDLKTQMITQINPLQQRMARAKIAQEDAQTQQIQQHTARMTAIQKQNLAYMNANPEDLVKHVYEPVSDQVNLPDEGGAAGIAMGGGVGGTAGKRKHIGTFSLKRSDANGGYMWDYKPDHPAPVQKDVQAEAAQKQQVADEKAESDLVKHYHQQITSQAKSDHDKATVAATAAGKAAPDPISDDEIWSRADKAVDSHYKAIGKTRPSKRPKVGQAIPETTTEQPTAAPASNDKPADFTAEEWKDFQDVHGKKWAGEEGIVKPRPDPHKFQEGVYPGI